MRRNKGGWNRLKAGEPGNSALPVLHRPNGQNGERNGTAHPEGISFG